MLLQEPEQSPYDWGFTVLGFPVRVAWTFWVGAVVFGYQMADGFDQLHGPLSPGLLPLLLLWCVCMLVSILIHELGHALAFRQSGVDASVVLYHFGGLAIPRSTRASDGFASSFSPPRLSDKADLWIALAGPLAQIVSAAVLVGAVCAAGYQVQAFAWMPWPLWQIPGVLEGQPIENVGLSAVVNFYVWPSVLWAVLNLIPVFPLDGGRIMRSILRISGDYSDNWLWISLVIAGAAGFYGFSSGRTFLGILFLSLAAGNYQMMQSPYR